ncbi:hypothetical protein RER83_16525 [Bacillus velezensis]|uniref:hypothetical protein n=1 Tax=Bacillus velezensis TaxID=492670 RepID=UPI0028066A7B|nr:hypothetical protein [Bacillus velezensis]MDQ8057830.1 hypothetical protein [Bacillus velezensis]
MADYIEVKAFFFGNEAEKEQVYLNFILPFFSPILGRFHAERGWTGGPHFRIILSKSDTSIIETFPSEFKRYCTTHFPELTKVEIETNLSPYLTHQDIIPNMERRESIPILIENHLSVLIGPYNEEYMYNTFNSYAHFVAHTRALFMMQEFISVNIYKFKEISPETQLKTLTRMLYDVLAFSSYTDKFSVLVYVSNTEGVFSIADSLNKKRSFEDSFLKMYKALEIPAYFTNQSYNLSIGSSWFDTVSKIVDYTKKNLDALTDSEDGFYSIEKQKEDLVKNIESIDSPFHKNLLNQIDSLLNHNEHKMFKFLINIIYKSVHMLGFTFVKKNFACFAVSKYVLDKHHTTWEEILKERERV